MKAMQKQNLMFIQKQKIVDIGFSEVQHSYQQFRDKLFDNFQGSVEHNDNVPRLVPKSSSNEASIFKKVDKKRDIVTEFKNITI